MYPFCSHLSTSAHCRPTKKIYPCHKSKKILDGYPWSSNKPNWLTDWCMFAAVCYVVWWWGLGRDGLTHNMLDLVHQHWRRRRVCKVTCKGVPTVDMDNVCNKLEVCAFSLPLLVTIVYELETHTDPGFSLSLKRTRREECSSHCNARKKKNLLLHTSLMR